MAPRSNWKGYIKLSLVSAAVAIYPATSSSEKVRFNTLNRETGNRLKRQMVDSVSGDVVESDEQVKGFAVGKDEYVIVEDDELANIAIESSKTIDIESFVPKASIDDRYRDSPYYIAPEDKVGQEAFAVSESGDKNQASGTVDSFVQQITGGSLALSRSPRFMPRHRRNRRWRLCGARPNARRRCSWATASTMRRR